MANSFPLVDAEIASITSRIAVRSADSRARYLAHIRKARDVEPRRRHLPAPILPMASQPAVLPKRRSFLPIASITSAIVTAYNDMLSAHQPLHDYPEMIKAAPKAKARSGAGRRRRPCHVRRRHPGPAGNGAVALVARRHRHGDRGRPVP